MADYSSAFDYLPCLEAKATVATLPEGAREGQLNTGDWQYAANPHCGDCPAHALNGGSHAIVGRHWCDHAGYTPPWAPALAFSRRFFRELQNYLSYQHWVARGWIAADPAFRFSADAYNNFATWFVYEITGASGRTLTLRVTATDQDPRDLVIFRAGAREDPDDPTSHLAFIKTRGSWCQVGDQVDIGGNSVLSGRVSARIVAFSFTALPTPATASATFTVTLDQTINNAMVKIDPAAAAKPLAFIYREAYTPEAWADTSEPAPLACVWRTVEYPVASCPNGIIELLNGSEDYTRIAWPIADREVAPGRVGESKMAGTFKVEIQKDGTWSDITEQLRTEAEGSTTYLWPRLAITQSAGPTWRTRLYLGTQGPTGPGQFTADLLDGADNARVTYGYEVADTRETDSRIACERLCRNCVEDYNAVLDAGSGGVNGVGTDGDGRVWYCSLRAITPAANLNVFAPGNCYQVGTCPNFQPKQGPGEIGPYLLAQLMAEQDTKIIQLMPGVSHISNYLMMRCGAPSFHWLANHPDYYRDPQGYWASTQPWAGPFVSWGIRSLGDGNYQLWSGKGAIYNWDMEGMADLVFPAMPTDALEPWDDLRGLFARAVALAADALSNHMQIDDDPWLASDGVQETAQRWWKALMCACGSYRDHNRAGSALAANVRAIAGREDMARLQRFNRRTITYVADTARATAGIQHEAATNRIQYLAETIGGVQYGARLTVVADGPTDHGKRRVGYLGTNARVARVEGLGGGYYRLHLMLGQYKVSNGVEADDWVGDFYGGGNAVMLPAPYAMRGHYGGPHQYTEGPPFMRAIAGDTIRVLNLAAFGNTKFWIVKAEPCSGDDGAAGPDATWALAYVRPGVVFDPPEGSVSYQVTKFEIAFMSGDGSYQDLTTKITEINEDAPRPTGDELDDIGLLWEREGSIVSAVYLDYTGLPTSGQTITIAMEDETTEVYEFFDGPESEYTGANIGVHIGSETGEDYTWNNLALAIDGHSLIAFATWDQSDSRVRVKAFDLARTMTLTSTASNAVAYEQRTEYGSGAAYLTYACYWWASMNGDAPERKARIAYTKNGAAEAYNEKAIAGCVAQLGSGPDATRMNEWVVKRINRDGTFTTYHSHGTTTNDWDFSIPLGGFKFNPTSLNLVFHPNESGHTFSVLFPLGFAVDLDDFPPSRDYPTPTDLAYLKKMDVLTIEDEGGLLAGHGSALVNQDIEIHTEGVIHPTEPVHVYWAERGLDEWHEITGTDFAVWRADGLIRIRSSMLLSLPARVCWRVDAPVANRLMEISQDLMIVLKAHCDALDTVALGGMLGGGGSYYFGAMIVMGASDWTLFPEPDSTRSYPQNLVSGWYWGYEAEWGGTNGINSQVDPDNGINITRDDLLLETHITTGDPYADNRPEALKADEGIYFDGGGGYDADYPVMVGVNSQAYMPGGAGLPGWVVCKAAMVDVAWPDLLKRLPADATVIEAHMEVYVDPGTEAAPTHWAKQIEHVFMCQSQAALPEYLRPNTWIFMPDPDYEDETDENIVEAPCAVALLGLRNDGIWEFLGSYLTEGATLAVGKTRVVDCTGSIQRMLTSLRDSKYRQFAMWFGVSAAAQIYPDQTPETHKFKSLINSIRHSMESITYSSGGSIEVWHEPPESWEEQLEMWHVRGRRESWQFYGHGFTINELIIRYRLPDDSIHARMSQGNVPILRVVR